LKINSDEISVSELARINTTEELTNTLNVLERIKNSKLSDWEKLSHNITTIIQAIKLKTEAAVYAFHKYDWLWEVMWEQSAEDSYWVEGFKRYWDKLQPILGRDRPCSVEDTINFFKKEWIKRIITGSISWVFCGVMGKFNSDSYCWEQYEISYAELDQYEQKALTKAWIEIEVLDRLI